MPDNRLYYQHLQTAMRRLAASGPAAPPDQAAGAPEHVWQRLWISIAQRLGGAAL